MGLLTFFYFFSQIMSRTITRLENAFYPEAVESTPDMVSTKTKYFVVGGYIAGLMYHIASHH